jgi:amino acid transporter
VPVPPPLPRTLGLTDLVLLGTVAIVNVNVAPPVGGFGRATLGLWFLAWLAFFVPESIAVLALSRRYPGDGGVYLWTRERFGGLHGFIAGWCYWTNSLFYVPVLLVYLAGVLTFAGGARTAGLVDNPWYIGAVAFGWLLLITAANIRGMQVGKWLNNIGGAGGIATVVLVALAAAAARWTGTATTPPLVAGAASDMAGALGVMCFAFIGIELASTMSGEIRDPQRDVPRSIVITGVIALAAYLLVADALIALIPPGELGAIQGVMQAVEQGAGAAGVSWMVAPIALVMALSVGGSASAWFAGPSRIPFVAGLDRALPAALGRVHPRWGSPYVALLACGAISAALTALSLAGSTVAEAYQVLLRAAVVLNLVPFVYVFVALLTLDSARRFERAAGAIGALVTLGGIVAVFLPTGEVGNLWLFELKMTAGVGGPIAVGLWLYWRSVRAARRPAAS